MSATHCPHCGELHDTTGCPTYPKGISGPVPMTLPPTVYCQSPEPVGSPAYARRLRDGMVARFLERHHREYADEWYGDCLPTAIERANDVVEALGYQVTEGANTAVDNTAQDLAEALRELVEDLDIRGGPQWPSSPMRQRSIAALAKFTKGTTNERAKS